MRLKLARALRKWADLLDPHVAPSTELTVRVTCDASQFKAGMEEIEGAVERWNEWALRRFEAYGEPSSAAEMLAAIAGVD